MSKTTAPATITLKTGRTGGTCADNFQYRDVYTEVKVGDFLAESLVTDTLVWEVIKITAKTVTVRATTGTGVVHKDEACDTTPNGLGVVWEEQAGNPDFITKTLRVRKDGSIRNGDHAGVRPLRPATMVNGQPCRRIDYRF